MAYATAADVVSRFRDLEPEEQVVVETRLDDAELLIRSRIPDLDTKITSGSIDIRVVVMVEADMILRLIRNPEGFTSETDGDYTYQISAKVASGRLEVLPSEWALLGYRRKMFTISPYLKAAQ